MVIASAGISIALNSPKHWTGLAAGRACSEGFGSKGGVMARLFVCDDGGRITADIEASGTVLREALDHEQADPVVRCAVIMALSALAEGGAWPSAVLECMSSFMDAMRSEVRTTQLA